MTNKSTIIQIIPAAADVFARYRIHHPIIGDSTIKERIICYGLIEDQNGSRHIEPFTMNELGEVSPVRDSDDSSCVLSGIVDPAAGMI